MEPQLIQFRVPAEFTLPKFYLTANPDRTSLALRVGALAVDTLFSSIASEVREEQNGDVVKRIEEKYVKRQDVSEREKKSLQDTLQTLHDKIALDERMKHDWQKQIKEETKELYKELLLEKEKQNQALFQEIRTLQEKMQGIRDGMNRTLGSQEKGRAGELQMEELLTKAFGMVAPFDLQSKGKEAQSGDIHMMYKKDKFLWEVKNYTRQVNKDEVDKLLRDMRANPDIKMGFMVSLSHGITGHTRAGDIDMERLEDGRFVVYLSNLHKRDDPVLFLQTLRPLLEIVESMNTVKAEGRSDSIEEVQRLKMKTTVVQHLLTSHRSTLQNLHNSLVNQKKKTDQIWGEQIALVRQAEMEMASTLKELLTEEEHSLTETLLNPELYTKTNYLELNEKEKKLVDWLKANCEESETSELESKVFSEKIRETFKEKELTEARKILQETVWPKQGKKIRGFRFLSQ
jgi:hypothetical protein